MIDVKAIAERCEKVPPAPWVAISAVAEGGDDSDTYFIKAQPHPAMRGFTKDIAMVEGADLADFIAHARQNIPDLLAENADLRRQITELQAAQRDRELRLAAFAYFTGSSVVGCGAASDLAYGQKIIDAFNTQEQKS